MADDNADSGTIYSVVVSPVQLLLEGLHEFGSLTDIFFF